MNVDIYAIQSRRYAIKRHDGRIFPERYKSAHEASIALNKKLGNGAAHGLAWIVVIYDERGAA